jgi:hypothetical protein
MRGESVLVLFMTLPYVGESDQVDTSRKKAPSDH